MGPSIKQIKLKRQMDSGNRYRRYAIIRIPNLTSRNVNDHQLNWISNLGTFNKCDTLDDCYNAIDQHILEYGAWDVQIIKNIEDVAVKLLELDVDSEGYTVSAKNNTEIIELAKKWGVELRLVDKTNLNDVLL